MVLTKLRVNLGLTIATMEALYTTKVNNRVPTSPQSWNNPLSLSPLALSIVHVSLVCEVSVLGCLQYF